MATEGNYHVIWIGLLEWHETIKGSEEDRIVLRQMQCQASVKVCGPDLLVDGDGWPPKLAMQLVPKDIFKVLCETGYFKCFTSVQFSFEQTEALASLAFHMDSGLAGYIHFLRTDIQPSSCNVTALVLLYCNEQKTFLGFIPDDQARFEGGLRAMAEQNAITCQGHGSGQSVSHVGMSLGQPLGTIAAMMNSQRFQMIWAGQMDWNEKLQGQPESQRISRQIACQVYSNFIGSELEVTGEGWPTNLGLHIIPKTCLNGIYEVIHMMTVKTLLVTLQHSEALGPLTQLLDSGFAGYVHFNGGQPPCTVRVLILLYSPERQVFLGFIINDQARVIDSIRRGIQQYKAQQTMMRQQGPSQAMPQQVMTQQPHLSEVAQSAQASAEPLTYSHGMSETLHLLPLLFEQSVTLNPSPDALAEQFQEIKLEPNVPTGDAEEEANLWHAEMDDLNYEMSLMEL